MFLLKSYEIWFLHFVIECQICITFLNIAFSILTQYSINKKTCKSFI